MGKGYGIGFENVFAHKGKIVRKDAGAVHATGIAGRTGMDVPEGGIKAVHCVPCFTGTFGKEVGQGVGVAVASGAAGKKKYVHGLFRAPCVFRQLAGSGRPPPQ